MTEAERSAGADDDNQIRAMEHVRGIRLASRGLYSAMHHAFTTPDGSVDRAAAMLALDEQISRFLSLPGNSPATALLAVGRIASEIDAELGARSGLTSEQLSRQIDQYLLASGFTA
ncbi:hypothetical protein [Leucobacter sp. 1207-22]|uniref:hypothetical protein n=1 Tax=Leucobacter sp. 1207-22 TaxID=2604456 RepID=UPI0040642612